MDQTNTNQHYISQALLKRFRRGSNRLQCFQKQTGTWRQRKVGDVCSARGYNQLLVGNQADHTIENDFDKLETELPDTLAFLDSVASSQSTAIPPEILANLRDYCCFLKLISPVAKPGAVVAFMVEINRGLEIQNYDLLRQLHVSEDAIQQLRGHYLKGGRIIIEAKNLMQQLYRFQFPRLFASNQRCFEHAKWFICNSPVEIPMSDVGLIPMHLSDKKANHYMLPISPNLVLEGIFYFDAAKNSSAGFLERIDYKANEAEYRLDCICASAITEIICSQRIDVIPQCIQRAHAQNIRFLKIVNPELAFQSGQEPADPSFALKVMTVSEFAEFIHTYMQPSAPVFQS